MIDHVEQFKEAMLAAGLSPPDHIEPGGFQRFPGTGKNTGNKAGYCKMFPDGLGGTFGDYSTDLSENWQAKTDRHRTKEEQEAYRREVAEARKQAEQARKASQSVAAEKAAQIWNTATPAKDNHPYLMKKGISSHGIKQEKDGRLIIPLRDAASSKLWSLQYIDQEGGKRFLTNGMITGCYFSIGKPGATVCLAEGFATAASIHQATGYPVAVAFNAGNLKAVAEAIRAKMPDTRLLVCADDDHTTDGNPGLTKAKEAAEAVGGLLASPQFSGIRPEKATDFNDLHQHGGLEAVKGCIEMARSAAILVGEKVTSIESAKLYRKVVAVGIADFLAREFPPRSNLLPPWLPSQGLVMVYAYRGIGKTHFALGVAYAVASGGGFLGWEAPAPAGVLYIDGEMPGPVMQERLSAIITSNAKEASAPFVLLTPDLQPEGMPRIDTDEGQAAIESILTDDIKLIVVDNISTLTGARENEADGWTPVQEWALKQRAKGRSVFFVHHSGKGGAQRGTSRREDVLDTVIALRRPVDYQPDKGAVFEVHFEKARGLYGEDVKPIEATLTTDAQGCMAWQTRAVEDSTFDRVVSLLNDGLTQNEIADELNINKSTVSRHKKKAMDAGLIVTTKKAA